MIKYICLHMNYFSFYRTTNKIYSSMRLLFFSWKFRELIHTFYFIFKVEITLHSHLLFLFEDEMIDTHPYFYFEVGTFDMQPLYSLWNRNDWPSSFIFRLNSEFLTCTFYFFFEVWITDSHLLYFSFEVGDTNLHHLFFNWSQDFRPAPYNFLLMSKFQICILYFSFQAWISDPHFLFSFQARIVDSHPLFFFWSQDDWPTLFIFPLEHGDRPAPLFFHWRWENDPQLIMGK